MIPLSYTYFYIHASGAYVWALVGLRVNHDRWLMNGGITGKRFHTFSNVVIR